MIDPYKTGLSTLVAILALATGASGQISSLDWSLSGCAGLQGDSLVVSAQFGGCTVSNSNASFTADLQGTYNATVDWTVAQPAVFGFIAITVDGSTTYSVPDVAGCVNPPCQGQTMGIPIAVEAGDVVTVQVSVSGAFGGSLSATVTGFDFTPDIGILPGGGALDASLLGDVLGVDGASQSGTPMAITGDLDQDGIHDYAVGVPAENLVLVLSGVDQQLLHALPAPGLGGGESLDCVGDIDGDGVDDLLVGRPNANGFLGQVDLWSGATGLLLFTRPGEDSFDAFGEAVSAAGDIDGDGTPDLLVGAPGDDGPSGSDGLVSVLSGVDGSLIDQFGDPRGSRFGSSLALVGDVTQDGLADLLVTAAINGAPGSLVQLRDHVTGPVVAQFFGATLGGVLRIAVASAGDLNGDGTPDFAIGTPSALTNGVITGELVAYSGADNSPLFSHPGTPGSALGHSLSAAGDVNGDDLDDLIVAAPFDGPGRAIVLGGPAGQVLFEIEPQLPTSRLAMTVTGGGDVNGDGFDDVLSTRLPYLGTSETSARMMIVSGSPADHVAPSLNGSGTLLPDSLLQLTVSDGQPSAETTLVIGSDHIDQAFHGGVLVPVPELILAGLRLDSSGGLVLAGRWPNNLPPFASIWAQAWTADRDALSGFNATNALQLIAP